ncbi:hypothetical protein B0H13DRAFT_2416207 [Mycena leptocephala]|nr:hypothetical protein B0H13DRAFT_2416207 [Mycena leptocephala]
MDPITVAMTVMTFSSFIKDLIEIGQSIQSSIEKVGENRRRIRELTKDVLRTLADLANLTRGQEDTFQVPALLSALGNLKAEMLHVLSMCYKISPVQLPGFRGVGFQIKVWMKRDDLERKIGHLKEHVNKCYLQFTAFSAARIEQTTARIEDTSVQVAHTTLRVEQTLVVNNVENQVRLRRLEGMMARVLLETQFACREDVHEGEVKPQKCTLVHALTTLSNCLAMVGRNDEALAISHEGVSIYSQNAVQMWKDFLYTIRNQELGANAFHSLSLRLTTAGELSEAIANAEKATELYRELVALAPRHLPTLAKSLQNLASILWKVDRRDASIAACKEAVHMMRKVAETEPYLLPALCEALDQLAVHLYEMGDMEGSSTATSECGEIGREIELSSFPTYLSGIWDDDKAWQTEEDEASAFDPPPEYTPSSPANESVTQQYYPANATTDIEGDAPADPAGVNHSSKKEPASQSAGGAASNTAAEEISDLISGSVDTSISTSAAPSSQVAKKGEEKPDSAVDTDTARVQRATSSVADILYTPLEIRLRSMPMDILWWIMGLVLGVLSLAFMVVWSHTMSLCRYQ